MTTDTLGPCPPTDERRYSTRGRWTVSSDYAYYWRRRAERTEGLLREMDMVAHQVRLSDWWTAEQEAGLENVRERVVAHFAEVKP